MAREIVLDSKLRQMAVCNGLETLLVHADAAARVLPGVLEGAARGGRRDPRRRAHARAVRRRRARERVRLVGGVSRADPGGARGRRSRRGGRARAALRVGAHRRDRHRELCELAGVAAARELLDGRASTAPPRSRTGSGSGSARRSASRRRSCTRSGRWGSRGSRRRSTSCAETASFANDADRRARRHLQPDPPRPPARGGGGGRSARARRACCSCPRRSRRTSRAATRPLAPGAQRLAWVEAACADNPRLAACDLEIARGGASYTVDTLRALAEQRRRRGPCSSSAATRSPSSAPGASRSSCSRWPISP